MRTPITNSTIVLVLLLTRTDDYDYHHEDDDYCYYDDDWHHNHIPPLSLPRPSPLRLRRAIITALSILMVMLNDDDAYHSYH